MGINKSARGNKRSDATAVETTRLALIKYPEPGYSVLRIYYPPDKVYGDKIYCYTGSISVRVSVKPHTGCNIARHDHSRFWSYREG